MYDKLNWRFYVIIYSEEILELSVYYLLQSKGFQSGIKKFWKRVLIKEHATRFMR